VCGAIRQAFEGMKTVATLKEEYVFVPAKVKEVYLFHILENLAEYKVGMCVSCQQAGTGHKEALHPVQMFAYPRYHDNVGGG
jgi:hypothetical protein